MPYLRSGLDKQFSIIIYKKCFAKLQITRKFFYSATVVTLDNCDVRVNVGETFVCDSVDAMISLVHQYCEDKAFMEKMKEACHRKAQEILAVDGKESYRRLCEFVENYTLEQEAKNR